MPSRSGQAVESQPGGIELPGYRDFVAIARSEGSEVYRAYQDGLDRPVAVKVLLLDDPEAVARFHREVEITVQLGRQHPHIVTVIDTGTTSEGRPCIVMEHYDRGSLHDRLRAGGPLPWEEVLAAGTVVADALSFAHRHGVLHRDVKPQNVLVLPTSYVVADFGIARRIDAARTTSVEWFSFRHAAPQVLDGEPPAVADDVWSLGSTMFTLLDGQPPFAAGNPEEDTALAYMKRVRDGRRRELNRHDVPAGLVDIIDQCLQHERADRFPDAATLHAELAQLAAGARAWAPVGAPSALTPPAPIGAGVPTGDGVPTGTGGRGTTRSGSNQTGDTASRPAVKPIGAAAVVPVQPAAMIPKAAQPLPATALPPPTQAPPPKRPAGATASRAYAVAPAHQSSAPLPAGHTTPPDPQATPPAQPVDGGAVNRPPGVLSPSALSRLVASHAAEGSPVAGDATIGPRYSEPSSDAYGAPAPAATGGSLRRVLVGTAVALLIGGVLGVGGTWVAGLVRGDADDSDQGHAPGGSPLPAGLGADGPSATRQSIVNPQIAPQVTDITAIDRTTVRLRWTDKSEGKAQFVVVRIFEDTGKTASYVVPGRDTEYEVRGLNPTTAPYCFHVLALTIDENGRSDRRCVSPPA